MSDNNENTGDTLEDNLEETGVVTFCRCSHINSNTKKGALKKNFDSVECVKCRNRNEGESMVLCLGCGKCHCGRQSENKHSLGHFEGSRHCLSLSIPSMTEFESLTMNDKYDSMGIWCYRCDHWLHESDQDNDVSIKKLKDVAWAVIAKYYKNQRKKQGFAFNGSNNSNETRNNNVNNGNNGNDGNNENENENENNENILRGHTPKNKRKKKNRYEAMREKQMANKEKTITKSETKYGRDNSSKRELIEKWGQLNDNFTIYGDNSGAGYIGVIGLTNLGNTCFFNSVLQNLFATRPFIEKMISPQSHHSTHIANFVTKLNNSNDNSSGNINDSKNNSKKNNSNKNKNKNNNYYNGGNSNNKKASAKQAKGRLMKEFYDLVIDARHKTANQSKDNIGRVGTAPRELKAAVVSRNRRFAGASQQDSHELMRVLIEGIREQNEIILKKLRNQRLYSNIKKWTVDDVLNWFKFYNINIKPKLKSNDDINENNIDNNNDDDINNINNDSQNDSKSDNKSDNKNDDNAKKNEKYLNSNEFCQFIKSPNKYGISNFLKLIGLSMENENDKDDLDKFANARKLLNKEECQFYCDYYNIAYYGETNIKNKMVTIIDEVFGGELDSCVTCMNCKKTFRTREEFFDLSLPISVPQAVVQSPYNYRNYSKYGKNKNKNKNKQWTNNKESKKNQSKNKNNKKNKHNKNKDANKSENEMSDKEKANEKAKEKENENENENENDNGNDDTSEKTSETGVTTSVVTSVVRKEESVDSTSNDESRNEIESFFNSDLPSIRGLQRLKGNCDLLDALQAFTDPEILSGNDKYGCQHCTLLQLTQLKEKQQANNEHSNEQSKEKENEEKKEESKENDSKKSKKSEKSEKSGWSDSEDENDDNSSVSSVSSIAGKSKEEKELIKLLKSGSIPFVKHDARKRLLISKAPLILTLHLKRFEQRGWRLTKVGKKVAFPLHLNLTKYVTPECKEEYNLSNNGLYYQLYGVSVHLGGMSGGHYIAYVHKDRNDGPKHGWFYFSDSSYHSVSFEEVLNCEAYILFYQRCTYHDYNQNINNVNNVTNHV